VERLWTVTPGRKGKRQEVFQAPAGSLIEVSLPREHPELPVAAPVYCSSSQAVKQKYRHSRPKPGLYRTRRTVVVEAVLTADALTVTGRVQSRSAGEVPVTVQRTLAGPFTAARDSASVAAAFASAFERLGPTHLELGSCTLRNDQNLFVPVSRLNALRRELVAELEQALRRQSQDRVERLHAELLPAVVAPVVARSPDRATGLDRRSPECREPRGDLRSVAVARSGDRATTYSAPAGALAWSIKIDCIGFLDAFAEDDFAGLEEIVVDIARDHPTLLAEKLEQWGARLGRERIRLALPALTRRWEDKGLRHKIRSLTERGWRKWEAANLSAWSYLGLDPARSETGAFDLATDWSVYVLNRLAARQLLDLGVSRFALSPEDGLENLRSLLAEFGSQAVLIVYQDTPQFLAESCAYANLIGGCPGKANCTFESMEMVSSHGEKVTALDYHCRTIVLNQGPFCLAPRLDELRKAGADRLRADFVYRKYQPDEVRRLWRLVRAGRPVPGGHAANFDRGLL
ncbi:MAG TPA: DUF3656 domain-containing protein, partial [Gemmataceae bacterium]|nr:DUF3656 domain-containing protein [Gemmataceae bacterium]